MEMKSYLLDVASPALQSEFSSEDISEDRNAEDISSENVAS